jgi:hypothetical protein
VFPVCLTKTVAATLVRAIDSSMAGEPRIPLIPKGINRKSQSDINNFIRVRIMGVTPSLGRQSKPFSR